jgi:hypothetical protein
MKIKDREGVVRITFENFNRLPDKDPAFIDMDVSVNVNNFSANIRITAELTDLSEMLTNLEVLNKTLKRTFYFQHIDEQIKIKFEPLNTGSILISGNVKNKDYSTSLEFKFETDQTYLPELIKSCKETIDTLS